MHERLDTVETERDLLREEIQLQSKALASEKAKNAELEKTMAEKSSLAGAGKLNEERLGNEIEALRGELAKKDSATECADAEELKELNEGLKLDIDRFRQKCEKLDKGVKERSEEVRCNREKVVDLEEEVAEVKGENTLVKKRLEALKKRHELLVKQMESQDTSSTLGGGNADADAALPPPAPPRAGPRREVASTPFVEEAISALAAKCDDYAKHIARLEKDVKVANKKEEVARQHLADSLRRLGKVDGKLRELERSNAQMPSTTKAAAAEIKLLKLRLMRELEVKQMVDEERGLSDKRHEREVILLGRRIQEQAAKIHELTAEIDSRTAKPASDVPLFSQKQNHHQIAALKVSDKIITLKELKSHGPLFGSDRRVVTPVRISGGQSEMGEGSRDRDRECAQAQTQTPTTIPMQSSASFSLDDKRDLDLEESKRIMEKNGALLQKVADMLS